MAFSAGQVLENRYRIVSPPEQYGLGTTDARSDIYAVGATLYALLTGETPVESVSRLAGATLPRPAMLTPPVARAILQAMEMEPQNRFQNATAFAMALSSQVVGDKPHVGRRRLWPVVAVAIVVLLAVAGFFLLRSILDGNGGRATPVAETIAQKDEPADEGNMATQTAIAVAQESLAAGQSTAPAAAPTAGATDGPELVEETIGFSAGGQAITLYKLGDGARVVTLVGGIHAGFAPGGVAVVNRAMAHFAAHPDEIPAGVALQFIPNSNPDSQLTPGELPGRVNANGVDINRNFGCAWSAAATWRNAPINAGDGAFSEPESAVLRDYFLDVRPAVVIFYDARAAQGWVSPGECNGSIGDTERFAKAYATASGYVYTITDPIAGDASNWLIGEDIPAFFILLRDYEEVTTNTLERNLDGIRDTIAVVVR